MTSDRILIGGMSEFYDRCEIEGVVSVSKTTNQLEL